MIRRVVGAEWVVFLMAVLVVALVVLLFVLPLLLRSMPGTMGALDCPLCGGLMGAGPFWLWLLVGLIIIGAIFVLLILVVAVVWCVRAVQVPRPRV